MRTKPQPPFQKAATDAAEVKRRFIRQNRELAKNNSAQSLKIRSLEGEVSKLLAHNLELRERNLALEHRLEKGQSAAVNRVKRVLKAKLEELSGLVDGIEEDDDEYARGSVDRERILSPTHQQYRERQPLGELMRDSQMPTINEGKSYPRQTLDASEIRAIRVSDGSAATGSPDLGPPPVARFDCDNAATATATGQGNAEDELLPSVNLETRRRRKDGPSEREIRRSSILALSPVKLDVEPAATSMLRTGAKRKLADCDPEKMSRKDDFSFTRKPAVEQESEHEAQETAEETPSEPIKAPTSPPKTARRVLGDKSVNMSPRKTAPAKTTKSSKEDPIKLTKPSKEDTTKPTKPAPRSQSTTRPPSRGRRISSAPQLLQNEQPVVASIELPLPTESEISLPPKTPAPPLDDIFSPESNSQPAALSRDTPPPSDLSSLSNTTTDARPSRRARSSVNYAEPSLVAKMRRPGKGMVDAISGLPQSRRSISVDMSLRKSANVDVPVKEIKTEPVDDEDWKATATKGSPLRERSTTANDGDKIAVAVGHVPPPGRESVVAESRKKREAIRTTTSSSASPPVVDAAAEKLAELDLYDFKDESSSPAAVELPKPKMGASGRRHSSVLKETSVGNSTAGALVAKLERGKNVASEPRGGRRRSMMI